MCRFYTSTVPFYMRDLNTIDFAVIARDSKEKQNMLIQKRTAT